MISGRYLTLSPAYRWIAKNTEPVGAGLPAKASSWAMQGLRPPSLASQLLHDQRVQLDCGRYQTLSPAYRWIAKNTEPCHLRAWIAKNTEPVGAGLPAKASAWANAWLRPPSLASRLLQGCGISRDPYPATCCPAHHRAAPSHETTPPPDAATRSETADTPDTHAPCAGTQTPAHSPARSMAIATNC